MDVDLESICHTNRSQHSDQHRIRDRERGGEQRGGEGGWGQRKQASERTIDARTIDTCQDTKTIHTKTIDTCQDTKTIDTKTIDARTIDTCQDERWGAGFETQKNVRGEIGGWGRVPFNETYAPSLSTIYDGA